MRQTAAKRGPEPIVTTSFADNIRRFYQQHQRCRQIATLNAEKACDEDF